MSTALSKADERKEAHHRESEINRDGIRFRWSESQKKRMAREQSHAPGGVHRNAGVGLYTRCEWNRELVSGSGSSGRRLLVTRTSGM